MSDQHTGHASAPVKGNTRSIKRSRKDLVKSGSRLEIQVLTQDSDISSDSECASPSPLSDSNSWLNTERYTVSVAVSPQVERKNSPELPITENAPQQQPQKSKEPFYSERVRCGVSAIQGRRKQMEDAHVVLQNTPPLLNEEVKEEEEQEVAEKLTKSMEKELEREHDSKDGVSLFPKGELAFFGVFDGHGGKKAADFAATNLHTFVFQSPNFKTDIKGAIKEGFDKTEADFLKIAEKHTLSDGTTALVAFIVRNRLYIGSVGDSEGVLCRKEKAVALNQPHNPAKNPSEIIRVEKAGGRVVDQRVAHPALNPNIFSIAVSRAIGDIMFKAPQFTNNQSSGLIADVEVTEFDLTGEDQFIILACDGLWDVMTHQEAVDFVLQCLKEDDDPHRVSKKLVDKAFQKGSMDNITAMICALQRFRV